MKAPTTPPSRGRSESIATSSSLSWPAPFTPPASSEKTRTQWELSFLMDEKMREIKSSLSKSPSGHTHTGRKILPLPVKKFEAGTSPSPRTPPAPSTTASPFGSSDSLITPPRRALSSSPLSSSVFTFTPPADVPPFSEASPSPSPRPSSRVSQSSATPPLRPPIFHFPAPTTKASSLEGSELGQVCQIFGGVALDDHHDGDGNGNEDDHVSNCQTQESLESPAYKSAQHSKTPSISHVSEVLDSIEEPTSQLQVLPIFSAPRAASPVRSYDILGEEAPLNSSLLPHDLKGALDRGIDHAKVIADLLQEQNDSAARARRDDARRLAKFELSATSTIAVLGDSGNGKSSLINALLHFPGIAKVGDVGSACTSVVTEYHQKLPSHTAPIHLEVEYLPQSKRDEVIADLLGDYRKFYLPSVNSDDTSPEEFRRIEARSAEAWCALETAFAHHKEFNEPFLQANSQLERENVEILLRKWSAEIIEPRGSENGLWKGTADHAEACAKHLMKFTSNRIWPFTKVVRVYLDSYILKSGIVLADLPGLKDTNLARVRTTEDYLLKCRHVFIVADIIRAITDASVKSSVFTVLSRHVPLEWEETGARSMNITIVCTKSDSIDIDAARPDLCNSGMPTVSARIKDLDDQIEQALGSTNMQQLEELEQRRKMLFVESRNDLVKRNLRRVYADKVPEGNLRVFCVSNRMYQINVTKGNRELVNASEVPALRAYCTNLTTELRIQEARHFLHSSLPILFNSTELWIRTALAQLDKKQTSLLAGKEEELLDAIEKMYKQVTRKAKGVSRDIRHHVNEELIAVSVSSHSQWHGAAGDQAHAWYGWHWTQFNAWCLRDGHHETAKRAREDWNAKIILKMRSDLASHWESVFQRTSNTFQVLRTTTEELLDDVKSVLIDLEQSEIRETINDQVDSLARDIRFRLAQVQSNLLGRIQCSTESNFTSYILKQMIPTYRDAASESGSGKAQRQRATVGNRLGDQHLFATMTRQLEAEMTATLETCGVETCATVSSILGQLKTDVEMIATADDGERLASCRNSIPEVEEAIKVLGELATKLEGIKQDVRELETSW